MSNMTLKELVQRLGRDRIAARLDVTLSSVREAVRVKRAPASWWHELDLMARDAGLEGAPRYLFSFREARLPAPSPDTHEAA